MIVKMKKLTLLCTKAQQVPTLDKLRDLGVVHVEHVREPEGFSLERAKNHLNYVQRAKEVLEARPDSDPTGKDPHKLVDKVWALIHREKELQESIQSLKHEIARITPFGEFDPRQITDLIEKKSLCIKLYELPVKDAPSAPEGVAVTEISRDATKIYVLAVDREAFTLSAHEVRLPDRSLSELERHLEKTTKALDANEAEFRTYAGDLTLVKQIEQEAADDVTYLEVQHGMGSDAPVCYLQGYLPIDAEEKWVTQAKENGWGYKIEDISDADAPPTLLRNPKWVDPIKAVFDVIGVIPGYKELDVSALFLIFLSIFFAFLIGDAGYGALFLGMTFFARRKFKKAPSYPFNLLYIMSTCTVVWGALTGTYFGITPEALPAPLQSLRWSYLAGDAEESAQRIMFICFIIGTTHLVIAHGWNLIRKINSWACLADAGWICSTLTMFYAVRYMVLDHPFPAPMMYVLGVGVVMIILSLVMEKEYFGLVTLVLDVISNFVDIISYVRLYAVGAASFAIANAFNEMAVSALGEKGLVVGGLIAALAIFGGHALNILLGAMGILVHGIRLNTLEFSSHAGVQWAGVAFNPFRKKTK